MKDKKRKKIVRLSDIQQSLKIWKMRNLTVAGKIVVFKIIVISRIVFQSFITTVGTWYK